MRVFLDANVLFSAASPESPTRQLLEAVLQHAKAVTNEHAWEEARRNVERKRPHLTDELNRLKPRIEFTRSFRAISEPVLPSKDQPVMGGAIASGCSHLWTGDKRHFGLLYGRAVHGTRIVSGIMLAEAMAANGWLT
jgi:uncharacterized protein